MYYVEQGSSFEATFEVGVSGLVGTVSVQIVDNVGNVVVAPSTAGIIEYPPGSGFYQAVRTAPGTLGQYSIVWTEDGSFVEGHVTVEDMTVVGVGEGDVLPPLASGTEPGLSMGPCSAWTTEAELALCDETAGSDTSVYLDAITSASRLLYELSGRQFAGTCERTVRPCSSGTACGTQTLSRGYVVHWGGSSWYNDMGVTTCGCQPLCRVWLSGYPVREILEVKIDGAVVDPDTYRLDEWRKLTRKNGLCWPACQDLSVDDTEVGSFSVQYSYGQNPPQPGQDAAIELACETYKAKADPGECALPEGVTRVIRQGIVIERMAFSAWGLQSGIWRTGLPLVDAFLNAYNPQRLQRRPAFWSPLSSAQYARPVGQ